MRRVLGRLRGRTWKGRDGSRRWGEIGGRFLAAVLVVMSVGLANTAQAAPSDGTVAQAPESPETTADGLVFVTEDGQRIPIHDRVDLALQQVYVSVEGRGGARVTDLGRDDFVLTDEGRVQDLVTFEHGGVPMTAVLLVDGSLSMEGEPMAAAREGLLAFLRDFEPDDEAKVVLFTDQIQGMSPFVPGGGTLPALKDLQAAGGSAVNDTLYFALQLLESRQGRRVVLLLSDGADNHSVLTAAEVAEVARRSQAMVYWVRLRGNPLVRAEERSLGIGRRLVRAVNEPRSAWREGMQALDERNALGAIVRESGGRILDLDDRSQIADAYRKILREIREQYALGYYPDPTFDDGRWRQIELTVPGRRGLTLRSRDGYYDF